MILRDGAFLKVVKQMTLQGNPLQEPFPTGRANKRHASRMWLRPGIHIDSNRNRLHLGQLRLSIGKPWPSDSPLLHNVLQRRPSYGVRRPSNGVWWPSNGVRRPSNGVWWPSHGMLGGLPTVLGDLPTVLGGLPTVLGGLPTVCGGLPTVLGGLPILPFGLASVLDWLCCCLCWSLPWISMCRLRWYRLEKVLLQVVHLYGRYPPAWIRACSLRCLMNLYVLSHSRHWCLFSSSSPAASPSSSWTSSWASSPSSSWMSSVFGCVLTPACSGLQTLQIWKCNTDQIQILH